MELLVSFLLADYSIQYCLRNFLIFNSFSPARRQISVNGHLTTLSYIYQSILSITNNFIASTRSHMPPSKPSPQIP